MEFNKHAICNYMQFYSMTQFSNAADDWILIYYNITTFVCRKKKDALKTVPYYKVLILLK